MLSEKGNPASTNLEGSLCLEVMQSIFINVGIVHQMQRASKLHVAFLVTLQGHIDWFFDPGFRLAVKQVIGRLANPCRPTFLSWHQNLLFASLDLAWISTSLVKVLRESCSRKSNPLFEPAVLGTDSLDFEISNTTLAEWRLDASVIAGRDCHL